MVVWWHIPMFKSTQHEVCFRLLLSTVRCAITRWYLLSPNDFSYFNAWAEAVSSTHSTTHRSRNPNTSLRYSGRPEKRLLFSQTTMLKWKCFPMDRRLSHHWGLKIPSRLWVPTQRFEFHLCLSLAMWVWTIYLIFQVSSSLFKKQRQS